MVSLKYAFIYRDFALSKSSLTYNAFIVPCSHNHPMLAQWQMLPQALKSTRIPNPIPPPNEDLNLSPILPGYYDHGTNFGRRLTGLSFGRPLLASSSIPQ